MRGRKVPRAPSAAERADVTVEWMCGDVLKSPFPDGSFDLVSMQYPALPKAAGEAAMRALLDAVRPGGVRLAVHHDLERTGEGIRPDQPCSVGLGSHRIGRAASIGSG